jgi:hypothetical protein
MRSCLAVKLDVGHCCIKTTFAMLEVSSVKSGSSASLYKDSRQMALLHVQELQVEIPVLHGWRPIPPMSPAIHLEKHAAYIPRNRQTQFRE